MEECNDVKCANHGKVKVRGNVFEGKVVSAKADKSATVQMTSIRKVPKYERYMKVRSKVHAHNPKCINAKEGDQVVIGETRKLSKTKSFVVMEVKKKAE